MPTTANVTPLERTALLAALDAPNHTLRRMRGGFVALGADVRTSGEATALTVTKRMALRLQRDGLVDLDEPDFPSCMRLSTRGEALARELREHAKEGLR